MGDVRSDGSIDFENARKVSPDVLGEHRARYALKEGDFVFGKIGTLGAPVELPEPFDYCLSANVILVQPRAINSRWLLNYLRSPQVEAILATTSRATSQAAFGIKKMRQLAVPLPPRAEQDVAVTIAHAALATTMARSASLSAVFETLGILDKSILARAFRGELVDQDSNDEPASVLLERIRAAREAATPTKKKRQRKQRKVATANRTSTPEKAAPPPSDDKPAPARQPRLPFRLADHDAGDISDIVFASLWGQGALDKDTATRTVAAALRDQGFCDYKRLRKDGALYAEVLSALERAVKSGHLDRPKRNHVRAVRPNAVDYTTADWRLALLATLGPEPTDRDTAIRAAATWAHDHLGLQFKRLRADGNIVKGLKSAINSAIRQGSLERVGSRMLRALS